jgi:alkylhydroperoxidase family enzyme
MALRVDIPEGKDPITWVWGEAVPGIGPAAARFSAAVYDKSTLSLREFEAARTRIAQINQCLFCLDWRTTREGQQVDESFYCAVEGWASSPELSERERLAAGYAEKFAASHLTLDDDGGFWARMHAAYTDPEIIELTMCVGSWIAFGRLNHVLGIDAVCKLPAH